ncbi:PAS domain S-box protein [Coleofasciculus sp. FACHB-1120]|uniref:PAS domain S-box protein n=1 Tax=Coleofasciculus sp. FACHB-1120 TaxID=2692783 RepID=UPI001686EE01|nr:PAS domain S-box protein [Coleofasciculus sp. FACHB-1120]MBD2740197.1 PAS domain S-box protein [Coleofasciculus sp. FACHB-1120]
MAPSGTHHLHLLWSDLPVRRRGALIIAIPIMCLLTSVVVFAGLQRSTAMAQNYVDKTQKVLLKANRLLTALVDAETGVQGYALTSRPEYLEPYNEAIATIPKFLQELDNSVKDKPQQLQRIQQIQKLVDQKVSMMNQNVARIRAAKQANAGAVQWEPQAKTRMDAIRRQITRFSAEEARLLEQRSRDLKHQQRITIGVLSATATLGLLGSLAAVYLFDQLDRELTAQQTGLRESNVRIHAILDNVVDGIITINEQGHIESFNQAAASMFGYEPAEAIGKNLKLLVAYPFSGDSIQALNYFVGGNNPVKMRRLQETVGRRKNGTTFPMELAFSEMYSYNQRLLIGIMRDITERKQSEEMLRKQATLLDLANDAILVRDRDDRITYWNQGAERLYGWTKKEALGQTAHELLRTEFPPNIEEIDEKFFHDGYWRGELLDTKHDGTQIRVSSRWTLQTDDEGEPLATLEINSDITERKQAEEDLRSRAGELARLSAILAQTNVALEKRNQELDQFAYIVSHDLKAPLRAIANLSTWIEEDISDQLSEETRHNMDLMRSRVHRMEALINGVLQYSRVGRLKASVESVDVEKLLAEVIDTLAPPPTFTIAVNPGMPTLRTERLPLQQVFANLISNAIKHNHQAEGQVTISVEDQGNCYEFAVADNGPGIAPEYHEKVFAIFETLQARDTVENTGIGLTLVKKIVETQGGSIWVESQLGKGATFRFTWAKSVLST